LGKLVARHFRTGLFSNFVALRYFAITRLRPGKRFRIGRALEELRAALY
jgi:hypothetical protein